MMTCEDFKWTEQMWHDFATMFIYESDQPVGNSKGSTIYSMYNVTF